jgi:UDPglucose 6-dehydrogenase
MRIGIIGQGFVGTAICEGMRHVHDITSYDKKDKNRVWHNLIGQYSGGVLYSVENPLLEVIEATDGPIFVCLPTPMRNDGSCDTSIVTSVAKELDDLTCRNFSTPRDVIIKSTVPPGFTTKLNADCAALNVYFSPEFLTEANANEDFKNQNRIILGCPDFIRNINNIQKMFSEAFPGVPLIDVPSSEAEMIKYVTNTFLATKVSLANEFAQICNGLGIDWDDVIDVASKDSRLGISHWEVPGPDGHNGFGGSCFPKDINGLICSASKLGIDPIVLKAVWSKNLEVRPERDWEQLKGRAVVVPESK